MQKQQEGQVSCDILQNYDYQILESSISELHKVLITIQNGISEEIKQIQAIQKILDSQLDIVTEFCRGTAVSLADIKKAKDDYHASMLLLKQKVSVVKTLNRYLLDRINQVNLLERKKIELIKKLSPAEVIEFRGKNEQDED